MSRIPISSLDAIASFASTDKIVALDASESEAGSATGTVILAWLGASLDMSTIASGGALPVARGGTGITSFGAGIAGFLGTPSSANLKTAVTDETGSGALVFANTPTLVTPTLGVATATSLVCPTFTSGAAFSFTPASGSNYNVTVAGAGNMAVNTNLLIVNPSSLAGNGGVGIGITIPLYKLHVKSPTTNVYMGIDAASAGFESGFWLLSGGTPVWEIYKRSSAGQELNIYSGLGALSVLTLTSTGRVGIQNLAPTAFLHLKGSTTAAASLNLPSGTAPTSPNNGDIWSDGSDIKVRLGGTTYTLTKS